MLMAKYGVNEDGARCLVYPILEIPSYFENWISSIELNDAKPKSDFLRLINPESDLFLSFNYTKTLECLYGIDKVCHIHGVQGEKLYFGHGKEYNYFSDDNYGTHPGTEDSFQKMHDKLKKETEKALHAQKAFFDRLKLSVNKIYSYGFSFSEVDEIYINEICKSIDTKGVTWYLNDYNDENTRLDFQDTIVRCGFLGSFDTYSINN